MSAPRHTVAPLSANTSSQSGTLSAVLVHDCTAGAIVQNQKYFHSSWEQHTHAMLNTGMNSEWTGSEETLRGGNMPKNICPASSVQQPSQGFHVCRICLTWWKGKAAKWRDKATMSEIKSTTDYSKPLCGLLSRKSKYCKSSWKSRSSNKHGLHEQIKVG